MEIGGYKIRLINAGDFALDGGAMFGVVPKALWERGYHTADDKNRIKLSTRLLYLEGQGRKILVDTGNGTKLDEKSQKIYDIDPADNGPAAKLREAGLDPNTITDVILTHLHFDHVGGATEMSQTGEAVPVFPNAKYHVQKAQLDWARNPTMKDRASFMPENYEPLDADGLLHTIDGPGEIFPNIHVQPLDGHTRGMQMLQISGDGAPLVYFADLCPTHGHLKLPYVMGYDNEPLKTLEEKQKHITQAAEEGAICVFEHDAYLPYSKLMMSDRGPALDTENTPKDLFNG